MITVLPEGGLCNRMRVVASCWLLAQASQQPMRVNWPRTPDFNARFDALFDTRTLPFTVTESSAMRMLGKAVARSAAWRARLRGNAVWGPMQTEPGVFEFDAAVRTAKRKGAFVRTNSRLVARSGMYDLFVPVGEAAQRIATLRPRLQHSVGVHIRRTDNAKATAVSTLESFLALMRAERSLHTDTEFFVATDEPGLVAQLQDEFGPGVWEHNKQAYERDDPDALTDAVIDLYALAHCRKLIGSYWSSFTDTASELRNIECVIARSPTP